MATIKCKRCGRETEVTCSLCHCPHFKGNNDGGIIGAFTGKSKTIRCKNCGVNYPAFIYCSCGEKNEVPTKLF